MHLDRSLFELQSGFARRVSAVTGMSLQEAFRLHTCFYAWLAVDNDVGAPAHRWAFGADHPEWSDFASAVATGEDAVAYAYPRYLESLPPIQNGASCFSYDYWPDLRWVRIHFENAPDGSGLRSESVSQRNVELRAIFSEIAASHPEALSVRGASWLYHVPSYRRLFPAAFCETLHSVDHPHQFLALWGQFLDRHGRVKVALGERFLSDTQQANSLQLMNECFGYDVLAGTCDIREFYAAYHIQ